MEYAESGLLKVAFRPLEAYKELYLYLLAGVWTVIFMRANITSPPATLFRYYQQPGQTKSYVDGKVGSASDIQSGDTVKTFSKDYKTVTTVYANGNQLVKTFSDDMKTITSVLTDSEGTVIATETKTLSDDGLTISTDVVYG